VTVSQGDDQRIRIAFVQEALNAEAARAVEQSIEIIRRRIDELGTREPTILRQGVNRIVVQAPGESDPERLKNVIGQTAKLTFQMVDESVPLNEAVAGRIPPGSELLPVEDGSSPALLVRKRSLVTGEMLTDAQQSFDQQSGQAVVTFRFNSQGARRFGAATSENIGKRFAIVLDKKIISAPVIQSAITGGNGQITGNFTPESANDLAVLLRAGARPPPRPGGGEKTRGAARGAAAGRARPRWPGRGGVGAGRRRPPPRGRWRPSSPWAPSWGPTPCAPASCRPPSASWRSWCSCCCPMAACSAGSRSSP
jgi:preprotein translocase subunit SecD